MSLSHRIVLGNPRLLFQLCAAETCASCLSHQSSQSPHPPETESPSFLSWTRKVPADIQKLPVTQAGEKWPTGSLRVKGLQPQLPTPTTPGPRGPTWHVPMQFSSGMSVPSRMSSRASSPEWPLRINPSNTICEKSGQQCQC